MDQTVTFTTLLLITSLSGLLLIDALESIDCTTANTGGYEPWFEVDTSLCHVYISSGLNWTDASYYTNGWLYMDPELRMLTSLRGNLTFSSNIHMGGFQLANSTTLTNEWYWGDRITDCHIDRDLIHFSNTTRMDMNELNGKCLYATGASTYPDGSCSLTRPYVCSFALLCLKSPIPWPGHNAATARFKSSWPNRFEGTSHILGSDFSVCVQYECTAACGDNELCRGFTYFKVTNQCRLHWQNEHNGCFNRTANENALLFYRI